MNSSAWRYAFSSTVGTSHIKVGVPCQDASACQLFQTQEQAQILVAVVSDGAGSAKFGGIGAELACSLFLEEMKTFFEGNGAITDITEQFVRGWLERFQNEVLLRAGVEAATPRDFACTFLAAVVGEEAAAFTQIGDGAIVVSPRDDTEPYQWVFWPQKGEYENVTMFATDSTAREHLQFDWANHGIDEVALFTDGLQRLALHFETKMAHIPFFRPMFAPLRATPPGLSDRLSMSLQAFLGSPQVNERTDDDKTLVLATRLLTTAETVGAENPDAGL